MPSPTLKTVQKPQHKAERFLEEHLNAQWLRPESALWDAIASEKIRQLPWASPSLDLGCGNGLFSFVTAGGAFTRNFDLYQESPEGVCRAADYKIDWGLDSNPTFLQKAETLNFYQNFKAADANQPLPFEARTFETIFSNMLYWLKTPDQALQEIYRCLSPGGQALLCFPDPSFMALRVSAHPKLPPRLSALLDRDRSESYRWSCSEDQIIPLVKQAGFHLLSNTRYLSPAILQVWDVGLRPLEGVLSRMTGRLSTEDRTEIKSDWIETLRPFLHELLALEEQDHSKGTFHLVQLQRPAS